MAKTIRAKVNAVDVKTGIMEVIFYIELDQDEVLSRENSIGPIRVDIEYGADGQPLTGDALTQQLGRRAPVGDLQRLAQRKMMIKPTTTYDDLHAEVGVERAIVPAVPGVDAVARP